MRRQDLGPWPAQLHKVLQGAPRTFAFGPVLALANRDQCARRLLQERGHVGIGRWLFQAQRFCQSARRRHAKPGRVHKGIEFKQIKPRKIGVAEPVSDKRRIQYQQRRIGRSHDCVAFGDSLSRTIRAGKPSARMAGMQRGKGQRRRGKR